MANEVILKGDLDKAPDKILRRLTDLMKRDTVELQRYVRKRHFGSFTAGDMLHNRTGQLRNAVRAMLPPQIMGMQIRGGLMFGKIYAFAHVGPRGQKITIRPKRKKWLTIPFKGESATQDFSASQKILFTRAGQLRGGALSGMFSNTFFKKSKAGNLILFGQKKGTKTMKTSQGGKIKVQQGVGKIVPLFLLKKQVRIRYRIHPLDLFKWFMKKYTDDIRGGGIIKGLESGELSN
uniref:Uncharacterized protein n=1 Tax=viral metagenome TaxID=1070528 RepID=A0A6M3L8N9_9ZZZZ